MIECKFQILNHTVKYNCLLQHRKTSHFFQLIDSYKFRRKKTLRDLMKQTAGFNPFPHRPTEDEIEARITAEDALRLKYTT